VAAAPPAGLVWKAGGIVLLGIFAFKKRSLFAGMAQFFCAMGDVLLELVFVAGLAAFAIGHLFFIFAFLEWGRILGPNKRDYPLAVLVVLVSAGLLVWLLPGMGDLMAPALAYQAIITLMVAMAFAMKAPMIARLGAVVFMVSDTLIAAEKFGGAQVLPGSVWITYAAAQIMLAWGLSRIAPYRDRARAAA
jgi:uncharacterized membrane protein YhhN